MRRGLLVVVAPGGGCGCAPVRRDGGLGSGHRGRRGRRGAPARRARRRDPPRGRSRSRDAEWRERRRRCAPRAPRARARAGTRPSAARPRSRRRAARRSPPAPRCAASSSPSCAARAASAIGADGPIAATATSRRSVLASSRASRSSTRSATASGAGAASSVSSSPQRAALVEVARELRREERVSRGAGMELRRASRRDRPPHPLAHQRCEAMRVEAGELQLAQVARAPQVGQHARDRMAPPQLAIARGHDQHELCDGRALEQMPQRLRGRRVAPVRVVEHDEEGRRSGAPRQRRADAAQQAIPRALGGHAAVAARIGDSRGARAELWHERRELRAGGLRERAAPSVVPRQRKLPDRPHPRLERHHRLGRAARHHYDGALCVSVGGGRRRVARLADPGLAQHQHRPGDPLVPSSPLAASRSRDRGRSAAPRRTRRARAAAERRPAAGRRARATCDRLRAPAVGATAAGASSRHRRHDARTVPGTPFSTSSRTSPSTTRVAR